MTGGADGACDLGDHAALHLGFPQATSTLRWAAPPLQARCTALAKLRLLALAAPQRSPEFPDVPTVAESGGPKDFAVTGWNAIAVPPGLPAAVTDKIKRDIEAG